MMFRLLGVALAMMVCLNCVDYATGQSARNPVRSVCIDTARNNCWPEPFTCPDRHAVRQAFSIMVHNGWRRQNLLADQHFVDQATELNESGRLKVRWILTEAPERYRTIYVRKGDAPEITAGRIASVQQWAMRFLPPGQLPVIEATDIASAGWPAEQVDAVDRKFRSTTPDPRLPNKAADSDSGP